MAKVTLEFTLPEERNEFNAAFEGEAARALIFEIDQHCRALIKHAELSEETNRCLQGIRDMIRERSGITLE